MTTRRITIAALLTALLAAPAMALDLETERFSTGIQFFAPGQFSELTVRVSGNGEVYEQRFGSNDAAVVDVTGLPDGNYTFEAVASPAASVVRGQEIATRTPEAARTWGHFTVQGGAMVTDLQEPATSAPEAPAGIPTKAQTFTTDLIVQGSSCIGIDCSSSESFGFDTLRLKENNLRIKFDDTSSSASFPSNDWQITANDSSNGGANKFSIDDITGGKTPFTIEAGAASNSLYVDDEGRIGNGTAAPVVNMHIVEGNTPTLRLEQDGSSGFTPQTWDLAGNEANFFVRDVTNGSKLPVQIKPGAPTASMFIAADGDIGLGTDSPSGALHLRDTDASTNLDFDLENSTHQWRFRINTLGQLNFVDRDAGNTPLRIGDSADNTLMQIGVNASNQVDITGNLVVSGTITPDYVFEADYELMSIDEQAAYMWKNKHLPSVGGAVVEEDGVHKINVAKRADGMLEELEKAHLYIEQLHNRLNELAQRLEAVESNQ